MVEFAVLNSTMTDKSSLSLALKYRPQTFNDVVGQENAVEFLRGLVRRGRAARHILLYGSVGSGKTTLARIYAKALNCEAVTPDFSPCLNCPACKAVEREEDFFAEINAPWYQDERGFRAKIDALRDPPPKPSERRVIFIDEAHSLRRLPGSYSYLLKILEEAPGELSFVFATTEPDQVSEALRSRMSELRVHPLLPGQGMDLLRTVAEKEHFIQIEDEGLMLLWRLGEGQPRNMLQALDQLKVRNLSITRNEVRDVFDVRDVDALLTYFVALGDGDFVRQAKCFSAWHSSVKLKLSRIQSLLVQIYYHDLIGHPVFVEAVVSSIRAEERKPILEAFQRRIPDAAALRRAWQEMLLLLPVYPEDVSEDALMSELILFQERVCASDLGARTVSRLQELPVSEVSAVVAKRDSSVARAPRDPQYLHFDLVKKIYNSASAFTQAFGRQFNVKITVLHEAFGCQDQKAAGNNAGDFTQQLSDRLRSWYGYGDRMLVQECDPSFGRCARVIASLPDRNDETVAKLQRWTRMWKADQRSGEIAPFAIELEVAAMDDAMSAHWECVRWLCAGLDANHPEQKKLNLEYRSSGDIGTGTRYASSASCTSELKKMAKEQSVPFLSALNAQAWDEVYAGWELEVYVARRSLSLLNGDALIAGTDEFRAFCERMQEERKLQFWDPQ